MEVFRDYAYFYDAFYKEKDYAEEVADVDGLLKKYGENVSTMALFGCGTGKHDREFAKLGYHCYGIDMSQEMIEVAKHRAKEENLKIDYEVADIREYKPIQKFDAVVSLFHVMSYQVKNVDIIGALKSARRSLNENGIFLFDVWSGPGVLTDLPALRVKEVEDDIYMLRRIARPTLHPLTNIVDVNYEILATEKQSLYTRTLNETHSMRYFFVPEMEDYMEQAGFFMLDCLDCNTKEEPTFGSWTVYFVAKAI